VYIGDLPDSVVHKFRREIRVAIVKSGREAYITKQWNETAVSHITIEELRKSSLEGMEELYEEVESAKGRTSIVQGEIERLFLVYMRSDEYVEEKTSRGSIAKRIPLYLLQKENPGLYARLMDKYGDSFVPLVDVVSLRDQSGLATQRLERLQKDREYTEKVKERAQQATALNKTIEVEDIAAYLEQLGWKDGGEEIMRNGYTGEQLQCKIFTGPVYYHRMTQMADEKIQSRANTGAISAANRRPVGGRKAAGGGGGKLEEMGTMALSSHGAASVIYERLTEDSAMARVIQCRSCNKVCTKPEDELKCGVCGAVGAAVQARIPFNAQRIRSMMLVEGIDMSFAGELSSREAAGRAREMQPTIVEEEVENFFDEDDELY
jgi:hypothetical protein